jgi:hypothetical protein
MMSDIHETAVLGEELTYRVISRNASVFTEGYDDLIL